MGNPLKILKVYVGFCNGKSQSEIDDLGVPPFQETPIYSPYLVAHPT